MSTPTGGLRASDAERAAVVARLKVHYEAGRLTLAELEERTRQAYAARTLDDLAAVTMDLPPAPELEPAPSPTPHRHSLRRQFGTYLALMVLLVGIWALSGGGYFWPGWAMLGWGFALLSQWMRGEDSRPRRRRHRRG